MYTSESAAYALNMDAIDDEHELASFWSREMEQFGKHGF